MQEILNTMFSVATENELITNFGIIFLFLVIFVIYVAEKILNLMTKKAELEQIKKKGDDTTKGGNTVNVFSITTVIVTNNNYFFNKKK